jgi:hypothetical protein
MPCACKQKDALVYDGRGLTRSNPRPEDNGVYLLQEDLECRTPYSGAFRGATVFIVGYGTEFERVYRRAERKAAIQDARENKRTIDQVPARALCHTIMVALLGA